MTATADGVVITGASTGIGQACALHFDAIGFRVFAGVRSAADADRLGSQASGRLTPIVLDVTREDSVRAAAGRVAEALAGTRLAGLVNNAGIAVAGPLEFLPLEALREQLEVNVVGQVAVTQAFLPLLRRSRGRIVNLGSVSGRFASPFMAPYSASKFALEAVTDALRVELRPWRIHVSILEPGVIATPIWTKSLAAAERLIAAMPPEAHQLYGPALDGIRARVGRLQGLPAQRVVEAVEHALTARRPRARYLIGRGARVRVALSYLPTRLRDWVVARSLAGSGDETASAT